MQDINWLEFLIACMISLIGGIVRKFSEIENDAEQDFTLREYILTGAISGFTGVIVFALLSHYNVSALLALASVGISGFVGSPLLRLMSSVFMKKASNVGGGEKDKGGESGDE